MKVLSSSTAFCLAFLLCFSLISNASGQITTSAQTSNAASVKLNNSDERYRIGFQDTLEITVYTTQPKFSQTVNIAKDGTVRLNRLPEPVSVVCKTEQELQNEITALYKKHVFRDPFVNVRAVEQRSQSFAVIGAVEKPGSFYLNRKIRLLELLAFAGGPDTEKAGSKLIVARTGSRSVCQQEISGDSNAANQDMVFYQYNIKDVQEGKKDLLMEPGDIVSVLDADVVYVYGNVNKQGPIKLTRPITLRQAISSAEGFAPSTKKDKIRIIRQKEGATGWNEIVFNLKEIENGKVQDPFLQPNDIVAVSEDPVKSFFESVKKSVTGGLSNLPIFIM